ncbi:MAG: Na(+)-translocating NADH-quinone reductase subunit A [Pseudomonadales bacterium]|nr:Na(+)-translocating NADH-quinone reductase subunit A [Pseudomonadales bacterium]
MKKIKRGLNVPICGEPNQVINEGLKIRSVAVLGADFVGMKPTMSVAVGDKVKKGQLLFTDKKNEGVRFTAPASGIVSAINRGRMRVLVSVVIDVDGDDNVEFDAYSEADLASLEREKVQQNLVKSGMWTAFRTRPYSKVPSLGAVPSSIFVTATDTNPLSVNPSLVLKEKQTSFQHGLTLLTRLTDGNVYLCSDTETPVPNVQGVKHEVFDGPHPAGLAGTHIHFLDPVGATKTVWSINYQDVIAIGELFVTGKLYTDRVISLAGPQVAEPAIVRSRLGACTDELLAGNLKEGENRIVSGSVLSGNVACGTGAYLGRYHLQVSVLKEGRDRVFLEYLSPGVQKHSVAGIYLSSILPKKLLSYTTSTFGSERAMVPVGSYEKVMPLDILPTQLLRALLTRDTDTAIDLGCLELDEEDLALCTYCCPGKYEYGAILRENLAQIEKES